MELYLLQIDMIDCWILSFESYYGRLTKVRDHNEFIKTDSMMKLVELSQKHEIDPSLILSIQNVLWCIQEALSIYQDMSSSLPQLMNIA